MTGGSVLLPHELEAGAIAYEAFRRACAGRSLETGERMRDWSELGDDLLRAWCEVAAEICRRYGCVY